MTPDEKTAAWNAGTIAGGIGRTWYEIACNAEEQLAREKAAREATRDEVSQGIGDMTPDEVARRNAEYAEPLREFSRKLRQEAYGLSNRKPDSAAKPDLTCFTDQFPLAMAAIAAVHDYERGPLVKGDYRPSLLRHLFGIGEPTDWAAVAWNAIAQLEISLRKASDNDKSPASV